MKTKGIPTKLANKFLSRYDLKIVSKAKVGRKRSVQWIEDFLFKQSNENIKRILTIEGLSRSQFKQDLFVLSELDFKPNGFFVEFGATNGVDLSNSYLLEKEFDWTGILCEPARNWHKELKLNRNCSIETDCIWSVSDEQLDFFEAKKGVQSTISLFKDADFHKRQKKHGYKVNTISLLDMLKKHGAPKDIDYLSVDTEGSEFEILSNFDFNEHRIKIITVEHNYTAMRERLYDLLTSYGYKRKYEEISQCDDWYTLY